jgi:hypothetical protein
MKIPLLTWGVYNVNRRTADSVLSKRKEKKLIATGKSIQSSRVIDCVAKILARRRWNAWHKRHCVLTAGGERVNAVN